MAPFVMRVARRHAVVYVLFLSLLLISVTRIQPYSRLLTFFLTGPKQDEPITKRHAISFTLHHDVHYNNTFNPYVKCPLGDLSHDRWE